MYSTEVLTIAKKIIDLATKKYPILPFIYVENSSGMGKTQLAFSIWNYFRKAWPQYSVKYFPVYKDLNSPQTIYKAFNTIREAFNSALINDTPKISADLLGNLKTPPLFVNSFIEALIKFDYNGRSNEQEFIMEEVPIQSKCPNCIFILDEFPALDQNDPTSRFTLRFIRNLFRLREGVVVLMGTSTAAKNLIATGGSSSEDSESPNLWCCLQSKLCPTNETVLSKRENVQDIKSKYPTLFKIILNSRPRFAHFSITYFSCIKTESNSLIHLKKICEFIFHRIRLSRPNFLFEEGGLAGQVCLFMNYYYQDETDRESRKPSFINHHFACAVKDHVDLYVLNNKLSSDNYSEFKNIIKFPEIQNDYLLYLTFMGFSSDSVYHPFNGRSFFEAYKLVSNMFPKMCLPENINTPNWNSGLELEALVAGASILASHSNGFSNEVPLLQFMHNLIFNFTLDSRKITLSELNLNPEISTILIPYFAPLDKRWPSLQLARSADQNVSFGENASVVDEHDEIIRFFNGIGFISRPKNQAQIDVLAFRSGATDPFMSIECKDRGSFDGSELIKVFGKIPESVQIAFIVCRTMSKTFQVANVTSNIPDRVVYRLDRVVA